MNIINFIDPIDPDKQRACVWWAYVSLLFVVLTLIALIYIQLSQYYDITLLRREHAKLVSVNHGYDAFKEEQKKIAAKNTELKNKVDTIHQSTTQFSKLTEQLAVLNKAAAQVVQLISCTLSEDATSIHIAVPSIDYAQKYIQELTSSRQFQDLLISAINPGKNGLHVMIKSCKKK